MIIQTQNTLDVNAPKTYLTNLEVSGTNVLRWKNPNGFSASWAIQVGETGEEQTEIVILGTATPAGTAGTLTGTVLYEHPADTPLYGIKYDQVVFERSTVGTLGTASPLGTVTYQPDARDLQGNSYTIYDDTSGSSTYGYRTYFRNSVLSQVTTESDWITSAGFSFYSLGALRQRVLNRPWNATFITDTTILDDWVNEWKDELTNAAIQVNEDYALGTVAVAFGTNGLGTITSGDFKQPKKLIVTYDGQNKYMSTKMDSTDFDAQSTFLASHPKHNWQGDAIFQVHPSDSAGTVELEYYKLNARMVNDTDELPVPMRGYTSSFVDYVEAQVHSKDDKLDQYDRKMARANQAKGMFLAEITPRDKTGSDYVKVTDSLGGDDFGYGVG